jgi:hypothetical protein
MMFHCRYQVMCIHDVSSIYRVPVLLEEQGIVKYFKERLDLPVVDSSSNLLYRWRNMADRYVRGITMYLFIIPEFGTGTQTCFRGSVCHIWHCVCVHFGLDRTKAVYIVMMFYFFPFKKFLSFLFFIVSLFICAYLSFLYQCILIVQRGFIVILPYMHVMYFDQIHPSVTLSYPSLY